MIAIFFSRFLHKIQILRHVQMVKNYDENLWNFSFQNFIFSARFSSKLSVVKRFLENFLFFGQNRDFWSDVEKLKRFLKKMFLKFYLFCTFLIKI